MKTKKSSSWQWFLPALVIWAVGLGLAAVFDLNINKAVYSPGNVVAIFMECFGYYPAFLWALLFLTLLATQKGKLQLLGSIAQLVCAGGLYLLLKDALEHWAFRGLMAEAPGMYTLLLAAAIIAIIAYVVVYRLGAATRLRLWFVSIFGTVLLACDQVLIKVLKTFWNRTRFDDMLAAGDGFGLFTPWYQPLGNGGTSFPSGHTANAACILALVVLCDVCPKFAKRRKLVYAICWAWIVLMAVSRVVIGRHYMSDTFAGAAVIAGCVFVLRRTKPYKAWVAKVNKKLETLEKANP